MSKVMFSFTTPHNTDIILMAVLQVADDLGWDSENEGMSEVMLRPPADYDKHKMSFAIQASPTEDLGSQVTIEGRQSGFFSSKERLNTEAQELQNLILAKGTTLTTQAIAEGYMCPSCGRLLSPGLLRCPHDGTPLAPPQA